MEHSPSRHKKDRRAVVLLSFDEWAEVQGNTWIREATVEEIDMVRDEVKRNDFEAMKIDFTSRPYLWVAIEKEAPGHIWRQAVEYLRILRFKDDVDDETGVGNVE